MFHVNRLPSSAKSYINLFIYLFIIIIIIIIFFFWKKKREEFPLLQFCLCFL